MVLDKGIKFGLNAKVIIIMLNIDICHQWLYGWWCILRTIIVREIFLYPKVSGCMIIVE